MERTEALVIGGGPAGLMAAEMLGRAGHAVLLAEAMPTLGRKFLMAGKSGLNLTKADDPAMFRAAYGPAADWLDPVLSNFGPDAVQDWARGLGQAVFTGSTGRVFPVAMKASPLLRAWAGRLSDLGVIARLRWRWTGWDGAACCFETPDGPRAVAADAVVLALGGASWARLGSDGAWAAGPLAGLGAGLAPFAAANAGVAVDWSPVMATHFGQAVKGIALRAGDLRSRGEIVLSARGIEGGGVYALSPALRDGADLWFDLTPDLSLEQVTARLARPRSKVSLSNHLRRALKLGGPARALMTEFARPLPQDPAALAACVKALKVRQAGLRPIDEAISTAGGVTQGAVDEGFMLRARPGVFCAGEMLDWEAPTGGYLLSACLATGRAAGVAAAAWLARPDDQSGTARPSART